MKKLHLTLALLILSGIYLSIQSQQPDHPATVQPSTSEKVKVYVKQDPSTYKKKPTGDTQNVQFAVQLSATSRPIPDKSSLKAWEEIGPVFIHHENGLYKIRIGPYFTQEEAKQALLKAKAKGRSDAFIAVQKGIENHIPYTFQDAEANVSDESMAAAENPMQKDEELDSDNSVEFKVRLASYLKPGGFNTKDIDQYGTLESYRKGDWTIMLIGGFKTAADAVRVRDLVIAKGYTEAKVVVDRGGVLEEF